MILVAYKTVNIHLLCFNSPDFEIKNNRLDRLGLYLSSPRCSQKHLRQSQPTNEQSHRQVSLKLCS